MLCDGSWCINTLLLSFREEMAGLQSNIDFLSNKLEASFEAQEWKGNSKLCTTRHRPVASMLHILIINILTPNLCALFSLWCCLFLLYGFISVGSVIIVANCRIQSASFRQSCVVILCCGEPLCKDPGAIHLQEEIAE
jgi:hypothetical protein